MDKPKNQNPCLAQYPLLKANYNPRASPPLELIYL